MSAYEIPNLRFSGESAGAIARRRFVVVNSAGKFAQAAAGVAAIGVAMVDTTGAGQVVEVADGIVIVEAGAAVVSGVQVEIDASGRAITLNTGKVAGYALTAGGAAGELISVKTN